MTLVSNDPSVWPLINSYRILSYFIVASCAVAIYDWALTFGKEFELVWRSRWSLMTVLYIGSRYLGISYAVLFMLIGLPSMSITDAGCNSIHIAQTAVAFLAIFTLGVIMITRLYAMYQRSRKMLVFLVVTFLIVMIPSGVITVIATKNIPGEELILYGTDRCIYSWEGDAELLNTVVWVLFAVWDVLALCLAVWIAVKHVRELRRSTTGWTIGDCFSVLLKTHLVYFASLVASYCFQLGFLSPKILDSLSMGSGIYRGLLGFTSVVQMSVLGPRLILDVREYHAKLVTDSDVTTGMTTIAFEERVHMSTGGDV